MTICNVLATMTIDDNTAVAVEGKRELFYNGIGVLDENGKPFEVLTVGMNYFTDVNDLMDKTPLLIKGNFVSKKMYV